MRASQDRHYEEVRGKTVHVAKNTHKGRSGVARRTWEVLRAGGVRRDALVEDGVFSVGVSMLGDCQCNVNESIGRTYRSKNPRMLRPLRLSSISLSSSSSPRKASAFGMSGILVGGWRSLRQVGQKATKHRPVVVVHTKEVGKGQITEGRDYICTRVDVVRKESELQTPLGHLSLSTFAQHRPASSHTIRTVLARPEGCHLATGKSSRLSEIFWLRTRHDGH